VTRGVLDFLADTTQKGMLKYIIDQRKAGSLAFFIAQAAGYQKFLFPEIRAAFANFATNQDWTLVEETRLAGYAKAQGYARRIKEIFQHKEDKGEDWVKERFEEEFA